MNRRVKKKREKEGEEEEEGTQARVLQRAEHAFLSPANSVKDRLSKRPREAT